MFTKFPTLLTVVAVLLLATGFSGNDLDSEYPESDVPTCVSVISASETSEVLMDVKQSFGQGPIGTFCAGSCSDFPCCFIIDAPPIDDPGGSA
ncbi:hypothetical protein [Longimonas halophila]|uniref:hypothetical protein n=1 Tax=Longimonas halophila TaxID=1469170 RepID=UPI0011440707|nr:hypothetical protein [Longimonas halophila]